MAGSVTPPVYLAYRQAPTPADDVEPIGTAGTAGTYDFMERQPTPGSQSGMADHAPPGWVVVGEGPGAKHRFSRLQFLMHTAPPMTL